MSHLADDLEVGAVQLADGAALFLSQDGYRLKGNVRPVARWIRTRSLSVQAQGQRYRLAAETLAEALGGAGSSCAAYLQVGHGGRL